jgi:signal transduction histidine kinase
MFATWLLSIILSIYLSIIINKMLKKYDDQIKSTNDKLIFQSRQALLGDLLPMIAHQWRQPINKIASIIALLRFDENERKDEKKLDAHYRQIEDNVEFMSETIDDFREFYQPKQSASVVNLKSLIEKSIEFIESAIRKKDIKLITDLDDINYTVYVNEFLQVMINLIKNAVDALDEGGVLEIKLYKEKGLIKIEVKDNGKGIKEDMLDKIFEPYVSTKKSMGLGLYMSKIIIEKHMKGELVASNNPNGGACFTITFKPE